MIVLFRSDYTNKDRWIICDHYVRSIIKKIAQNGHKITGQTKALQNMLKGLDNCGFSYYFNPPEKFIKKSTLPIMLFGQSSVVEYLDRYPDKNFVVGPALYSHPIENPRLAEYENVRSILVPGPWMEDMCKPYWGEKVITWPVGIDTQEWVDSSYDNKTDSVLIYNKIMWPQNKSLLTQIINKLDKLSVNYKVISYGKYNEDDYMQKLKKIRLMIYLCEHETQGIAYQQALSMGIPLLAWDRNSFWQDPRFYPERIQYKPASSVPYWDVRCGEKFESIEDFELAFLKVSENIVKKNYDPRAYILENLTLEISTQKLLDIVNDSLN